jgi:hypothetical protein
MEREVEEAAAAEEIRRRLQLREANMVNNVLIYRFHGFST